MAEELQGKLRSPSGEAVSGPKRCRESRERAPRAGAAGVRAAARTQSLQGTLRNIKDRVWNH